MFKRVGTIVLPLIVLAGLRRCPQRPMMYNIAGQIDGNVVSTGVAILALGAIVAVAVYMSRLGRKAV